MRKIYSCNIYSLRNIESIDFYNENFMSYLMIYAN